MYKNDVCPNCGYCPHCGRGGHHLQPYNPWSPPLRPYYIGDVPYETTTFTTPFKTIVDFDTTIS